MKTNLLERNGILRDNVFTLAEATLLKLLNEANDKGVEITKPMACVKLFGFNDKVDRDNLKQLIIKSQKKLKKFEYGTIKTFGRESNKIIMKLNKNLFEFVV